MFQDPHVRPVRIVAIGGSVTSRSIIERALSCVLERAGRSGRRPAFWEATSRERCGHPTPASPRQRPMRGWATLFGAALNSTAGLFDERSACCDSKDAGALATVAEQVMEFACLRGATQQDFTLAV
jgi:hypothetical protein